MVVGNTPFRGETVSELKKQILEGFFTVPDFVSPFCQDLINGVLKSDPLARYSLLDMQNHYWLGKEHFPQEYEKYSLVPSEEEMTSKPEMKDVWNTLHNYGVSPEMIKEAATKGVRSSIVGSYRIVLYQVQSKIEEERKNLLAENMAQQESANNVLTEKRSLTKRTSKLCTIL